MDERKILFFDGVCNLCNGTVDFIMSKNPKENIYFSSLQSPFAVSFLGEYDIDLKSLDTIYYYKEGEIYKRSEAVFEFLMETSRPYSYLRIFRFVPTIVADSIYNWIAKRRYNLLGKTDSCRIPTKQEENRFLEA